MSVEDADVVSSYITSGLSDLLQFGVNVRLVDVDGLRLARVEEELDCFDPFIRTALELVSQFDHWAIVL